MSEIPATGEHVVHVPGALRSYSGERPRVVARGGTLGEVLRDLDRRCPGIRFRVVDEAGAVRRHIRIFVAGQECEDLQRVLAPGDELHVMCALSGG